jgi:hypothetical protein
LTTDEALALMAAQPDANVPPQQRAMWLGESLRELPLLQPGIEKLAHVRAAALLQSHRRVRDAAQLKGVRYEVRPHLPADLLGLYALMPVPRT